LNWLAILEHYDLPRQVNLVPIGGTASQSLRVETATGNYILRCRPAGMAKEEFIEYDHTLRTFLADHYFPTPRLKPAKSGYTWVEVDGQIFEMSCLLAGQVVPVPNARQLHSAGHALALFHQLTVDFDHPGKANFVREDHVSILQPLLDELYTLAQDTREREELDQIQGQLKILSTLDADGFFEPLQPGVIHGDLHPGNVLFTGNYVSALLDYDYASPGPAMRDIGDGLVFFASRRPRDFDLNDIWSLTQGWKPDTDRAMAFLRGYTSIRPLPDDWPTTSHILLSRWLQVKLRGSRKVPKEEKIRFVLTDLWDVVRWLEHYFHGWFTQLIMDL